MAVTSAGVPVKNVLLCGEVVWAKFVNNETEGSSEGIDGPNCVTMPPPELTPLPAVDAAAPPVFTLTPCRLTLCGPAATPRPTLRSTPPDCARNRISWAISGP